MKNDLHQKSTDHHLISSTSVFDGICWQDPYVYVRNGKPYGTEPWETPVGYPAPSLNVLKQPINGKWVLIWFNFSIREMWITLPKANFSDFCRTYIKTIVCMGHMRSLKITCETRWLIWRKINVWVGFPVSSYIRLKMLFPVFLSHFKFYRYKVQAFRMPFLIAHLVL